MAEGRITRAYLEPQPDDSVPRFAYEEHLADLAKDPPQWPQSTRRISQLRVTIEYTPASGAAARAGAGAPARRHRRLSRRVADRPAAAGAVVRGLVAPGGRGGAGAAARGCRQGLARVPLRARCRCPRERAGRAGRHRALHALSAGRPRAGPRAHGAGTGPLPAAGRPRRLSPAHLLPAAAEGRLRLPARQLGGHAGAPLRELQDARGAAVLPRPLRPPRPADRAHRCALRRQRGRRRARRSAAQHGGDPQVLPAGGQHLALRHPPPPHRPAAVRRHQGRPSAPHQPRPAGGDPAARRRQGHRAGVVCRARR